MKASIVIVAWIRRIGSRLAASPPGGGLLLTPAQFRRQLGRERIRATRRRSPFCLLTVRLIGGDRTPVGLRRLARLLRRNLRVTDDKGMLSPYVVAVLLVDTQEMGGRIVLDRVRGILGDAGISAELRLQVHDGEAFNRHDGPEGGAGLGAKSGDFVQHVDEVQPMMPQPLTRMAVKRLVDVVGAAVGLCLASPLLLLAAIAIRATSQGPIFFRQTREGLGGRPFTIWKLRTMVPDAERVQAALRPHSERDGPAFKMRRDPRVTRVGWLLRATCIDELPQLWNVLRGEMSLVGPRPLPWHESRACHRWHRRRLHVRPGITCRWQVAKHRVTSFDDWMRMDLDYVDRHSFWQDVTLLARTMAVPLLGRGGD